MKRWATILLLLVAGVPSAVAQNDPLRGGLDRLAAAIEAIGAPQAGEVASERADLVRILDNLRSRARDLVSERASHEVEQKKLEALSRDRDARLRQLDLDQQTLDGELADLAQRGRAHRLDGEAQHAAARAASTPAQVASANAWGQRVNARSALLVAEYRRIEQRQAAIEQGRAAIASDIVGHAQRFNWLQRHRSRVDRDTTQALRECSAALSRATALRHIANAPARTFDYVSPEALAEKTVADLFKGLAKEGAMKGLEGRAMMKVLPSVARYGQPVGQAYTVADTTTDVAMAGVDHRTKEVTKNLFLLGDYGAVMKKMIQAKGGAAANDAEYQAMRAELERLTAEMPSSTGQVLLEGFGNSEAFITALVSLAGQYTGKKAERAASKITNHLNNMQRQVLGTGGVKFFRNAFESMGAAWGEEMTKLGAQGARDAVRQVQESRSRPNR